MYTFLYFKKILFLWPKKFIIFSLRDVLYVLEVHKFWKKMNSSGLICLYNFFRSANVVDLTKIMPTLSGATINMTVLMTTSMGLEGSVKGDFTQYLRGIGPLLAIGDFSVGWVIVLFLVTAFIQREIIHRLVSCLMTRIGWIVKLYL